MYNFGKVDLRGHNLPSKLPTKATVKAVGRHYNTAATAYNWVNSLTGYNLPWAPRIPYSLISKNYRGRKRYDFKYGRRRRAAQYAYRKYRKYPYSRNYRRRTYSRYYPRYKRYTRRRRRATFPVQRYRRGRYY